VREKSTIPLEMLYFVIIKKAKSNVFPRLFEIYGWFLIYKNKSNFGEVDFISHMNAIESSKLVLSFGLKCSLYT
jgi:hypothetical protein